MPAADTTAGRAARRVALTLLGVLIAGCAAPAGSQTAFPSRSASQPPASASAEPSASAVASPNGAPTVALDEITAFDTVVGTAPDWPTLLDSSLWVLAPDGDDPAVVRLDPDTGAEQVRIPLPGGSCEGIVAGFDSIWACTPDGLARIDPDTDSIGASVPFQTPQLYGRPAVGDDAVWSLSGQIVATDLVRIDPRTNAVTDTYPLGVAAAQLTYGLGYLWATATAEGLLLRIDPANGKVTTAADGLVDPYALATGAGHVWVSLQGAGADVEDPSVPDVFRFNPARGAGKFFDYGLRSQQTKSANTIYATDDAAWLKAEDPFLMRLNPDTGKIEWIVTSDRGSGIIVISKRTMWMTLWRDNAVVRIDL
jgi:hypothetical protein